VSLELATEVIPVGAHLEMELREIFLIHIATENISPFEGYI
jgi:hypothetical protein